MAQPQNWQEFLAALEQERIQDAYAYLEAVRNKVLEYPEEFTNHLDQVERKIFQYHHKRREWSFAYSIADSSTQESSRLARLERVKERMEQENSESQSTYRMVCDTINSLKKV